MIYGTTDRWRLKHEVISFMYFKIKSFELSWIYSYRGCAFIWYCFWSCSKHIKHSLLLLKGKRNHFVFRQDARFKYKAECIQNQTSCLIWILSIFKTLQCQHGFCLHPSISFLRFICCSIFQKIIWK